MPGCGCARYCSQLKGVVSRAMELYGCRVGGMYLLFALPAAERMLCAATPCPYASKHSVVSASTTRCALMTLSMVFPPPL
ncbi:hypothetical protein DK27_12425 [Xanthomonas arboricola pv. pruni]|nr:hypothetical protein DK27_12425 [Xanthomonas arboricola pv. pruni]